MAYSAAAAPVEGIIESPPEIDARHGAGRLLIDAAQRFFFAYLFLSDWIWLDELAINPTRPIRPLFNGLFGPLARWSGRHLFHRAGPLQPNSFRDTRYLYCVMFVVAAASILIGAGSMLVNSSRRWTETAYAYLRVWIRYTLAYMMLIYAMDKVFPTQFTFPTLRRLTESFGHASPMALLWTYVGYSSFLIIFSGLAEASGAVLLLFRRTAPLGALICLVMMANVALMDFCYDVSVKMLSAHFLIFSIFLLAHDRDRLLNVLAFNRTAPPADLQPPVLAGAQSGARPGMGRWIRVFKVLVVLYVVIPVTIRSYRSYEVRIHLREHVPLYGLYELTSFEVNGQNHPLVVTEGGLWRYVILENPGVAVVEHMDDTLTNYDSKFDQGSSRLEMHSQKSSHETAQLTLAPGAAQAGELFMDGSIGADHVTARLKRVDPESFTLVSRGFHWINETSFSR